MHPSQQAKYGLRTDEDVALAERFLAASKKAGWSDAQAHGLLQYYATVAPALERGQITPNDALNQLWDFAALQGIGEEQRAPLLKWHETTDAYIEAHDGKLPPMERLSPDAMRAELAEIQKIQREDPDKYWRDETLQGRMYDLIEQSRGEIRPLATATPKHLRRLSQIEGMMGDHGSAYWAPATGPAIQSEYRNLLSLAPPDGAAATPADAGATTQGD